MKDYNKEHYKQFKVFLKIEEYDELNEILKQDKVSKASFLRYAIQDFIKKRKNIYFASITKDERNKEE
jgi:lipopolysaccharide biosynthesis glycosyltransferase